MAITDNNSIPHKKKNLLYYYCQNCQRKLRVSQIQLKQINKFQTFNIFIFYCRICDMYYLIFRIINSKKEKRGNRYK